MAIGVRSSEYVFDILDNPYIYFGIGKAKTDWVITENTDISLRKCTDEESFEFYGVWYKTFKGNMLCINDPGNLKIKSNWLELDYENPFILINEC
jgi:hypothetical protein